MVNKEEKMNKSNSIGAVMFLMVLILSTILLASQGGCENRNRTEVVGFPQSFADLADKVKPAVVNISTTSTVTVPGNPFRHFFGPEDQGPFGDFFKKFFENTPDRKMKQQSLGSGFIIDKEGFIITNNHVVENAEDIKVKLADGREFKAKVIGKDPKTDLALIKITSIFENLPLLSLGDSDSMRVGDWVLAVGNPFGLGQTVTQGIISATGRVIGAGPYDDFLQTDAPINPGNSGGPLVNLKGEVIGINTAIISGGQGLGFAIPSKIAKSVTAQLRTKGKVVRGWLGVAIQTVTPEIAKSFDMKEPRGALVSEVTPGGPADKGGIKQGDIVVSFDGKSVKTANDLPYMVAETPVGKTVPVTVIRSGKEFNLNVRIEELTEQRMAEQSQSTAQTFGMTLNNLTPQVRRQLGIGETTGVVVVDVEAGSIADQAGIRAGDVIKEVNHRPVRNMRDFNVSMEKAVKGQPLLLLVKRGQQVFFVTLESSE
jgi:serine protease Do